MHSSSSATSVVGADFEDSDLKDEFYDALANTDQLEDEDSDDDDDDYQHSKVTLLR